MKSLSQVRSLRDASNERIALLKNQIENVALALVASTDVTTLKNLVIRLHSLSFELVASLATFKALGVVSGDLPNADLD